MTVDSPSGNYADVSSHWPLLQPGAHQYGLISRSDMARRTRCRVGSARTPADLSEASEQ
jgi:hypothetical protein